jgi:hypothetical protein
MNGADGETRITKISPLEKPYSKLGLVITMVVRGI